MDVRSLNPAVSKSWLLTIAGLAWAGVGVMLCNIAIGWLRVLHQDFGFLFGLVGLSIGVLFHLTIFSRMAKRNIDRVHAYPARVCIFAFQAWRGYLIIGFMITLGIVLRRSSIPRELLAVAYLAVGTALILSGAMLARQFFLPMGGEKGRTPENRQSTNERE